MSDHGHDHAEHLPVTEGDEPVTEHHILEAAIRELLIEKEVIAADELTRVIEALE
ncbi:MAG: nitrile hydratase subunit alpha, partial [SAR324 cluster bacterium]|nr:nitrile hydratase subunit alpha [SAR324 cluster bacterium]